MSESIYIDFNDPDSDLEQIRVFLKNKGTFFTDCEDSDLWWLSTSDEEDEIIRKNRNAGEMPYLPFIALHPEGAIVFVGAANVFPDGLFALATYLDTLGLKQILDENGDPMPGTLLDAIGLWP